MPQHFPDFSQNQPQQPAPFPNTAQRTAHFPQQQIHPHPYQQFQQQQQQSGAFARPASREDLALAQGNVGTFERVRVNRD